VAAAAAGVEDGNSEMIKAWYAQEDEQDGGVLHLQQQQQALEAAAVSPAGAKLGAGVSNTQQLAGEHEAAAAGLACADAAAGGVSAALTKQSAQLELGTSQQLQSSYSLVDWQPDKESANVAASPAAVAVACHATTDEDEVAPLLNSNVDSAKQPLPLKAAVEEAAAATGAVDGVASSDVTIRTLLASPAVLVFMWRALIIGLGLGTIGNFLFLCVMLPMVHELGAGA
jgi:hypothetical protein